MASRIGIESIAAPHRTRCFWLLVAGGLLIPLAAPLFLIAHGLRPFPMRVQLTTGAITFALWMAIIWCWLRFGRVAAFIIAILFIAIGLYAMRHV